MRRGASIGVGGAMLCATCLPVCAQQSLIWHVAYTRYDDFDFAFESVVPKSADLDNR